MRSSSDINTLLHDAVNLSDAELRRQAIDALTLPLHPSQIVEAILKPNAHGRTPLDIEKTKGGTTSYLQHLLELSLKDLKTPLHCLAKNNAEACARRFIETIGMKQARRLALQVDDKGEIPLESLPESAADSFVKLLESITLTLESKEEVRELTTEETLARYPHASASLRERLTYACHGINQANRFIKTTSTSPIPCSEEKYEAAANSINKMRAMRSILKPANTFNDDSEEEALFEQLTMYDMSLKYSAGNCEELVNFAGIEILKVSSTPVLIESVSIENGDHRFGVIGRLLGSDITYPTTWGPEAVIFDPYLKLICLASELERHMKCIISYEQEEHNKVIFHHILVPYQKHYHDHFTVEAVIRPQLKTILAKQDPASLTRKNIQPAIDLIFQATAYKKHPKKIGPSLFAQKRGRAPEEKDTPKPLLPLKKSKLTPMHAS